MIGSNGGDMRKLIIKGAIGLLIGAAWPLAAQAPSKDLMEGSGKNQPVKLARLVMNLRPGETIGSSKYTVFCAPFDRLTWDSGTTELRVDLFYPVFNDEMNKAGFKVAGDPSNLFGDAADERTDYLIGGSINHVDMSVCYPGLSGFANNYDDARGKASIDVEWQLYSQLQRKVVATLKTTGLVNRSKSKKGGALGLLSDAFGDAVRQLALNEQFAKSLSGPTLNMSVARAPTPGLVPLQLKGAAPTPIALSVAVASTAVIFANSGEGSGFLISADGYMLTNHHVVGGAQFVKVRWSDGTEVLGEVIRSDKPRDVALIKTDPKGHTPLALRAAPVSVGEEIYAIGAPTGARFQNTLTKGIVSAIRVYQGHNFIQSDVGVTYGNSGGPLIDGKGQVIGLTDLGFEDAPMVNLFIPIAEAQSFLGLQVAAAK